MNAAVLWSSMTAERLADSWRHSKAPRRRNFEEPVTQGTLKVVGAFLGSSYARSYARRLIDPLESWSSRGVIERVTWAHSF